MIYIHIRGGGFCEMDEACFYETLRRSFEAIIV